MPSPFDEFLSWLSSDREEAAVKYEMLRGKLIKYFTRRGCHITDELADVTIDRASGKIAEGKVDHTVKPEAYCFGIARNVAHEYWRNPQPSPLDRDFPFVAPPRPWSNRQLACFRQCWARRSKHHRGLFRRWHQPKKGREKIEEHKKMAETEGGINALRIKIHRIRNTLRDCVAACLRRDEGSLME